MRKHSWVRTPLIETFFVPMVLQYELSRWPLHPVGHCIPFHCIMLAVASRLCVFRTRVLENAGCKCIYFSSNTPHVCHVQTMQTIYPHKSTRQTSSPIKSHQIPSNRIKSALVQSRSPPCSTPPSSTPPSKSRSNTARIATNRSVVRTSLSQL